MRSALSATVVSRVRSLVDSLGSSPHSAGQFHRFSTEFYGTSKSSPLLPVYRLRSCEFLILSPPGRVV
jgi:hypothetical protein